MTEESQNINHYDRIFEDITMSAYDLRCADINTIYNLMLPVLKRVKDYLACTVFSDPEYTKLLSDIRRNMFAIETSFMPILNYDVEGVSVRESDLDRLRQNIALGAEHLEFTELGPVVYTILEYSYATKAAERKTSEDLAWHIPKLFMSRKKKALARREISLQLNEIQMMFSGLLEQCDLLDTALRQNVGKMSASDPRPTNSDDMEDFAIEYDPATEGLPS